MSGAMPGPELMWMWAGFCGMLAETLRLAVVGPVGDGPWEPRMPIRAAAAILGAAGAAFAIAFAAAEGWDNGWARSLGMAAVGAAGAGAVSGFVMRGTVRSMLGAGLAPLVTVGMVLIGWKLSGLVTWFA
jgi:hypothetical protein